MHLKRIRSNGEIYEPYRNRKNKFVMADPAKGITKHLAVNHVYCDTLQEVCENIEKRNFHLWMKGNDTGQQNLISPKSIEITKNARVLSETTND